MNNAQPDPHVGVKPNLTRMRNGIDIYHNSMRRYIAQKMQLWEGGDWFYGRLVPALPQWRREEIAQYVSENDNPIDVLEVSDLPDVVRGNKEAFPSDLVGKRSTAVTWMHEVRNWRNDCAHPPMDDFSDQDAVRALDTCARVLRLVDPKAEKQVTELFDDPQEVLQRAQQAAKKKLEDEQAEHTKTRDKLKHEQAEHAKTKDKLKDEQAEPRKTQNDLCEVKRKPDAAHPHLPSKPAGVPVRKEVEEYRKKFKPAKSGKGWTYQTIVEKWFVTRWVGQTLGEYRACVFPPSQKFGSEWTRATEESLIDQPCNSEEEAFAHLQRAEQSGKITRSVREAIEDYEPLDSGSDDDISF